MLWRQRHSRERWPANKSETDAERRPPDSPKPSSRRGLCRPTLWSTPCTLRLRLALSGREHTQHGLEQPASVRGHRRQCMASPGSWPNKLALISYTRLQKERRCLCFVSGVSRHGKVERQRRLVLSPSWRKSLHRKEECTCLTEFLDWVMSRSGVWTST